MRRLMRWAARLYPATWRARYGRELEILMDDSGASWTSVLDLLRGAFVMQLRSLNFWKIAGTFTVLGALAAGLWSFTIPARYISSAVLTINSEDPVTLHQRLQSAFSRSSLTQIVQGEKLYSRERARQPLEDVIEGMRRRDLRVTFKDKQVIVSFAAESPGAAQGTVRKLVQTLTEQDAGAEPAGTAAVKMLVAPTLPSSAVRVGRLRLIGGGLLGGLVFGILIGGIASAIRTDRRWNWRMIAGSAAAGLVIGLAVAFTMPDQFMSTAVLSSNTEDVQTQFLTLQEKVLSQDALLRVVQKYDLYPAEPASIPAADAVRRMQHALRVSEFPMNGSGERGFIISFQYPDPVKAQAVVDELVSGFKAGLPLEVIDPASRPASPSSPNRLQLVLMAVVAGTILGAAASHFRRPTAAVA